MRGLDAAINVALLCIPAAAAALISRRLSKRSTDEWALLAWVPPLPLAAFTIYLAVVTTRDPTAANLWPFVMVAFIALTAILYAVFLVARRALGSGDSKAPEWSARWRRGRTEHR
jgi:hypothetical protein